MEFFSKDPDPKNIKSNLSISEAKKNLQQSLTSAKTTLTNIANECVQDSSNPNAYLFQCATMTNPSKDNNLKKHYTKSNSPNNKGSTKS